MRFDSSIRAYGEPGKREQQRVPHGRKRNLGPVVIVLAALIFWGGLAVLLWYLI
nr:hypothetical protein [Marinicella sp. W31]MDC2876985.1 hypothetical protein [Marinicella sp. W31]